MTHDYKAALDALDWIITNGNFTESDTDKLTTSMNKIRSALELAANPWQPIETAPMDKYVILNIMPLNYPVIAARDSNGWMTRTGAFYGIETMDKWMPIPPPPSNEPEGDA